MYFKEEGVPISRDTVQKQNQGFRIFRLCTKMLQRFLFVFEKWFCIGSCCCFLNVAFFGCLHYVFLLCLFVSAFCFASVVLHFLEGEWKFICFCTSFVFFSCLCFAFVFLSLSVSVFAFLDVSFGEQRTREGWVSGARGGGGSKRGWGMCDGVCVLGGTDVGVDDTCLTRWHRGVAPNKSWGSAD